MCCRRKISIPGDTIDRYLHKYREWAVRLGVELPGLDDPGKAFAPCTKGEILGLYYDTERWVWYMTEDKGRRLLASIWKVLENRRGCTMS